jgi:alpha-1,3-rhamnosyl/mannosyltransferase
MLGPLPSIRTPRIHFPFGVRSRKPTEITCVKLALSMLCENPDRRTGLTTLFHEFVAHGLRLFPDLRWVIFAGPDQLWEIRDPRIEVVRDFPANNARLRRIWADQFRVGPAAKTRGADALLTVGFVPRRAPLPVVMHVFSLHHLRERRGWRSLYRHRAIAHGLERARLVIANSQWTADQITAAYVETFPRQIVSPEGVQHDRFFPAPAPDGDIEARNALALPERYLLWSSNFYPYKRVKLVLAAYAALDPRLRTRFPLVLVGGDWNGGQQEAEDEAARLGIKADTRFLGWIEDRWLPACYRGARAHLLSSEEETFGRSVLEAMACGCPCLVHDLPVLREVAGEAAEFINYSDTPGTAPSLARLCEDDARVQNLRAAGLARARLFSFERLARERITAIEEILPRAT